MAGGCGADKGLCRGTTRLSTAPMHVDAQNSDAVCGMGT